MGAIVTLALALPSQGTIVTPMQKVVSLLKDLSAKVKAEGAKEAAQYDKFACFCKEQADEKLYNIEKSRTKISNLNAEVDALEASIAELNSEVGDLSKRITSLHDEIQNKTSIREKQHAQYELQATDMQEAIDACADAIEALKASKKAMSGAKLDLAQVATLSKIISTRTSLAKTSSAAALLAEISGAPKFQYQSNDIIATIENLMATFKSMKKDLDTEEFDANSSFEKDKLGLSNEKKFAEKDKADKESLVAAKTDRLNTAKLDRDEETKDMNADQSFLDVTTKKCEETAALFDQRSETRADEIRALTEATAELQKGAVPNFKANKKLVDLQKPVLLSRQPRSAASFVQVRSLQNKHDRTSAAVQRVKTLLQGAATQTGTKELSTLLMRVGLAEDHFVKVRALIKDLIARLENDATSEATQKSMCDKGMHTATSDRDEANARMDLARAHISTETANVQALKDEIAALSKQVAGLKKTVLEATELRAEEKADNTQTMQMSQEGIDAVKLALGVLKDFYEGAFVQKGQYVPPNSDRNGKTVGDLAPEIFDSSYHGVQSESKGIIGILEVILADFDRTHNKVTDDEKESQQNFEEVEKMIQDDIDARNTRIATAQDELAQAEDELLAQQQSLQDATELFDSAEQRLADLKAMCVDGLESWAERKKKREEEIAALKEALEILENWQN